MPEPVRVGVVGSSWWADLLYLPSLTSHPQAQVVAVCGRDHGRAEALAHKYGVPQVFTDYRAMIAQAGLHALVVSTPDDLHHPIAMQALDAGLHVLCEKPLALSVAQARELYERAEAMAIKHMVLFTYRWLPPYQLVRQLIDQGYLGRIYNCHMRYVGGFGRDPADRWRLDPLRARGVVGDIGSHIIDLARWYVGDVAKVSAHLASFVGRVGAYGQRLEGTNDSAMLALLFQNGAQAAIQLSSVVHIGDRGQEQQVILSGEDGTLEIRQTFASAEVYGVRHDQQHFTQLLALDYSASADDPAAPPMAGMLAPFREQAIGPRLFIDAIVEDRPITPNFYDGLKAQEVIDAAFESHQRGSWVGV
jgi:predicted dehydrogenase